MDNAIKHKSTFLVQKFIGSNESHLFHLSSSHIAFLFIIARYIDMPDGKCYANPETLWREMRISRPQYYRILKSLIEQELIEKTYDINDKQILRLGLYFSCDKSI